jgi:superfamily II RNA helicase
MSFLSIYDNEVKNDIEEPAMDFKFPLDLFQNEACFRISKDENVFVTAHTGCGKTVVALYGIAHTLKKGKRVIYTSPTKSLSNQKYEEFAKIFPNVGILTGDIKMNADADCVIMTTEILLNILYKGNTGSQSITVNSIGAVIFDEVHYINDPDRGKVWEETLVLLPREVNLILLSATIDKADQMADWLGNIKQKNIHLISTKNRVVPLRHYFWDDNYEEMVEIIDDKGNFYNYNEVKRRYKKKNYSSIINNFVRHLKKNRMLPAIYFKFSRVQCERCAKDIIVDFVTPEERKEIDLVFRNRLSKYKEYYGHLQQYEDVYKQLLRGVVYHHSGLIPILKEIIEILYARGLIKLLFATETFAVGVNMPAKTVIFNDLKKYDNNGLRHLRTDEYLQMSGRAGRRGLDKNGTVIILPTMDLPDYGTLKSVMSGRSPSIKSKFVPSYQFILKALHNNDISVDKFIETTLFSKEEGMKIKQLEKKLRGIKVKPFPFDKNDKKVVEIDEYLKLERKVNNKVLKLSNKDRKKVMKRMKQIKNMNGFEEILCEIKIWDIENEKRERLVRDIDFMRSYILGDVEKIVEILRDGYLDSDDKLTEKGLIAIEVNDCNPIIFTELIYSKYLEKCTFEEIVGLFASFIDEKSRDYHYNGLKELGREKGLTDNVIDLLYYLDDEMGYLEKIEKEKSFEIQQNNDYQLKLDFVLPAYMWAKGCDIKKIYEITDIYEGNFVRGILRINSMIEDVISVAENLGYFNLKKIMEGYEEKLIRDVVTINSLYIC